ncbi:MAG TPA: glycoside hydrolase family 3 N-terminal domain-containing protein [Gemmatimonadales bacterium]|nr:glycoside hydrolase family 3 N-terminal domain-containing protein [Gemmatimonadales bacterium]
MTPAGVLVLFFLLFPGERPEPTGARYRDSQQPVSMRVRDLLGRMTLEEKFWQLFMIPDDTGRDYHRLAHGVFGLQIQGHDGWRTAARIDALQHFFVDSTRLGIPIIPFDEALHGLAEPGATAFPQAIALAATWDTALMGRVAGAIAVETRARGIRQVLSPVLNVASDVRWGRVEETYGEDPLLASAMGVAFIRPFEAAGVITTPKHFVANVGEGGRDSYPAYWSERWMEELFLPPFEAAIREGGARSLMAAYNSVDGTPATASRALLTEQLRERWGFRGFVIADAGATGGANVLHMTSPDYATSGKLALEAGLDVLFQTSSDHSRLFWPAFQSGAIPLAVIDSAVARVLRAKFELGLFEHPYVDRDTAGSDAKEHRLLALEAARASITLLRNQAGTLPLSKTLRRLVVIGPDAVEARLGGYSGSGNAPVSMLDGIRQRLPAARVTYQPGPGRGTPEFEPVPAASLGPGLEAEYFDNITLEGTPRVRRVDPFIDFRWTLSAPDTSLASDWYSVRWTGRLIAPRTGVVRIGVEGNDGYRLYLDDRLLIDNWKKQSYRTTVKPVRLLRGRAYRIRLEYFESTGNARIRMVWDAGRPAEWRAAIARAVSAARQGDAVVIAAGIEEGEFRDRASLRLPGHQEALIRAVAATGRPVTVVLVAGSAVTMTDWVDSVGAVLLAWYPGEEGGHAVAEVLFGDQNPAGRLPITFPLAEGQLPLSYYHAPTGRGDDYLDLTGRPLFPFGFGLSYTRFEYSGLTIEPAVIDSSGTAMARCRVRNAGAVAGDEVVQLYVHDEVASVARPVMQLAGFQRIHLAAGEQREVHFPLGPKQLALLDREHHRVVEPGRFRIMVGASSADIRLRALLTVR